MPLHDYSAAAAASSFSLITDTLLGADTANFDFTSIPSTYTHLRVVLQLRGTKSAQNCVPSLRLNNASGAGDYEYSYHYGNSTGTDSGTAQDDANSFIRMGFCPAASATAGRAAVTVLDIPNYKATTFVKCVVFLNAGAGVGGSNEMYRAEGGGTYFSTSAINQITVFPDTNNWLAGSRASLYGIT